MLIYRHVTNLSRGYGFRQPFVYFVTKLRTQFFCVNVSIYVCMLMYISFLC